MDIMVKANYDKLLAGMFKFLDTDININLYPFVDVKNGVFVSEDTEYKYENLKQFYDISVKNNFPVTAFCVAKLADTHKDMMKIISDKSFFEIGSHSYTHKKIVGEDDDVYLKETKDSKNDLEKITNRKVIGFRPPREEVDDKLISMLEENGYKFILNKHEPRLYPYFMNSILVIPRHGTDDYAYLIQLDWDSNEILQQMIKEVNNLVSMDALYSISTHTHLMSYGTNIDITDKFMQYVNTQKDMVPMSGEMIYDRIYKKSKLNYTQSIAPKKVLLKISNSSALPIKNIHFEIEVNPDIKLTGVSSEIYGINTEIKKDKFGKSILIIDSLPPKSENLIFINYDKNS